MGYAFISYSSHNQAPADAMRELLKKNNIDTWMAPYDIPIGSKYAMVISRAVKDCACFILLLTDHAQNSVWVAKEVERAINYRKPIIPIQLEDLVLNDEFELYISNDQIVALSKIDESPVMDDILKSVAAYTGSSLPKAEEKPKKKSATSKKPSRAEINRVVKNVLREVNKLDDSIVSFGSDSHADSRSIIQSEVSSSYKLPSTDLLKAYRSSRDLDQAREDAISDGEIILKTLENFGISATIRKIDCGPRVTRYQVVPSKGVKVSRITNLNNDISLMLGTPSIRIETPIPGQNAIGIEIPSKHPEIVSLRELVELEEFNSTPSKTSVCIGKDVLGTPVYADVAAMPHAIITGATGMGKSACINSMITSILYKASPADVRFILIDPKKVEFSPYNGIPHLLVPIITEAKPAVAALMWAIDEMNRRYAAIEKIMVRNIDAYNDKVDEDPECGSRMPKIIIVIDELSDLMLQERHLVETYVMMIAQKARGAGIHLIIGTQRPSVNVLTGVIKANIPSRISFKVATYVDSQTAIDQSGAERLLNNGDMFFAYKGTPCKRVQGAFVSEAEMDRVIKFIKANNSSYAYDNSAITSMDQLLEKISCKEDESTNSEILDNADFLAAVTQVIVNGSASTSFLQRKLHIGYGKAAQFIEEMENLGIVSEANGSKPRKVLMTITEWEKKRDSLID